MGDRILSIKRRATAINLLVWHETDGRKYLSVLEELTHVSVLPVPVRVQYGELVCFKRFIKRLIRGERVYKAALQLAGALRLRVTVPWWGPSVIVAGLPPYDCRVFFLIFYSYRHSVIYHNSWPYWRVGRQPRTYWFLTPLVIRAWRYFLAKRVDSTVSVTQASERALMGFSGRRGNVIPQAVEDCFFLNSQRDALQTERREGASRGSVLKILYVGYLEERKGVDWLLELAAALGSSISITLIGDGPLRQEVLDAGCVNYIGQVDDRQVLASYFRENDVIVVPSRKTSRWEELFSRVLVEGMASGLVPVATDHVGPQEIITDGVDGMLVGEGDFADFVEKIRRLCTDDSLLNKLSRNATRTAERYHVDAVFPQWAAMIESSLKI